MELDAIYAKTQKGLEEMATRAYHLTQRFRQVLLLIDGKTSVAALASRFHNETLVQEALDFLASEQFIVPGQPSSPNNDAVMHESRAMLTSAQVAQVLENHLSSHLGPMAALVVTDHIPDRQTLLQRSKALLIARTLAAEIDTPEQRLRFLQDVTRDLGH